jgi:hypothetical protein
MNEYGLFGDAKGKSIKVWYDQRSTKYLLSFNYIPANFEGILIGPSVSNNLDTKEISDFKIYNGSLNGGNISELKYIAENAIRKGNLKFMIVCLFPYITKDHGRKTSSIDPHEYWGTLGSRDMVKLYAAKFLTRYNLMKNYNNDYGCFKFQIEKAQKQVLQKDSGEDSKAKVNSNVIKGKNNNIEFFPEYIDEVAYKELDDVLKLARDRNVQIFAFYYPYYIENFNEAKFNSYKDRIDKLFTSRDFVWNFNEDKYSEFRSDLKNYYDKGHLSNSGTDFIIREINHKLITFYKRTKTDFNPEID